VELVKITPQQVSPHFVQPKAQLTSSKELATNAYTDPHEISTHPFNRRLGNPL